MTPQTGETPVEKGKVGALEARISTYSNKRVESSLLSPLPDPLWLSEKALSSCWRLQGRRRVAFLLSSPPDVCSVTGAKVRGEGCGEGG